MKLAWLTDIHLNFLKKEERLRFYNDVAASDCESVLISGDIAEAPSVVEVLEEMIARVKHPIYFVLGNHDYYDGSVERVRKDVAALCQQSDLLFWLPYYGPQSLSDNTLLLGQDGWADGRYGDYVNSLAELNDSNYIQDLVAPGKQGRGALLDKMQALADADAKQLQKNLLDAVAKYPERIIVLTHVPPFETLFSVGGRMESFDFLPYYTSKATGDVVLPMAEAYPGIDFLVLCGHMHEVAEYQAADNLIARVGSAKYGSPQITVLSI